MPPRRKSCSASCSLPSCGGVLHVVLLAAAVCQPFAGCAGRPEGMAELGAVSGTVTLDGQPLVKAVVQFQGPKGQTAFGRTDEAGRYVVSYVHGYPGAPLGKNVVRISGALDGPPPPGYRDPVPAKYNARSTLTVEVAKQPNTFDFELSSKP